MILLKLAIRMISVKVLVISVAVGRFEMIQLSFNEKYVFSFVS